MKNEPFLPDGEPSELWKSVYASFAYALASAELKGQEQKEGIKEATEAVITLICDATCIEMKGRLETLKFDFDCGYNDAVKDCQDQIY